MTEMQIAEFKALTEALAVLFQESAAEESSLVGAIAKRMKALIPAGE